MKYITHLLIFSTFLLIINNLGTAQANKKMLAGHVIDRNTEQPVLLASVRNVITGKTVLTHSDGRFVLEVAKGNLLSISATGYYTDTLTITDSAWQISDLRLQLKALPSTLPDAVVTSQLSAYQQDSLERRRAFLADVGEARIPAVGKANDLGFGVAVNLDRWSKREKNKRKARDLFEITEEEAYINYRWNKDVVQKYTRFEGEKLNDFMQANRPNWEWLRKHQKEEDLLYYINKSLKK